MWAGTPGHLAGRLPAAAAEPWLQAPLGEEELQRARRVCSEGGGVGGGQVQRRESTVGLGVQFGSVLQEEARHGDSAPAAGAVKRRPAVGGARVDPGPGGDQGRNHIDMAAVRRAMQWSVAVLIAAVHQRGISGDQPVDCCELGKKNKRKC